MLHYFQSKKLTDILEVIRPFHYNSINLKTHVNIVYLDNNVKVY